MTQAEKMTLTHYQQMDKACPTVAQYSRNLNLLYLKGLLDVCYHREEAITQIQKLLMRKGKANVLLTGVAGCGKTALVEGTAAQITQRKLAYERTCAQQKKEYRANLRARMRADGADAEDDAEDEFVAPTKRNEH